MNRKKYSAGAVKVSFWFMEFKKTVQLLNEGNSLADIKKLNENENIYGAPTREREKQIFSTVSSRIKSLDSSIVPIFVSSDLKTQKLIALTACLGKECKGKAWVIVTSQQDIDSITKVKGNDFSKIQGRFDTRLALSSANVDTVIKERILKKNETAAQTLRLLYPQIEKLFIEDKFNPDFKLDISDSSERVDSVMDLVNKFDRILRISSNSQREGKKESFKLIYQTNLKANLFDKSKSNLESIPYMAGIMADYETIRLERLAEELNWGHNIQRMNKVQSIRLLRQQTKEQLQESKIAQYQLQYLLKMYPQLEDVIDSEFNESAPMEFPNESTHDETRGWLSKEEYNNLPESERNQLALDRYIASKNKSKWQIGRDYELSVGYEYQQMGYSVDYFGSYMGLEDLGRDLICKKNDQTIIVQCKYWSKQKQIHENHINQLYGTKMCYCIERGISPNQVSAIMVTNTELSDMAKKMAHYLKIEYRQNNPLKDYPRIKCNVGKDEDGKVTKIYHLPFDQMYDVTKIMNKGECFAFTVKEAEEKGFRRARKWFGNT